MHHVPVSQWRGCRTDRIGGTSWRGSRQFERIRLRRRWRGHRRRGSGADCWTERFSRGRRTESAGGEGHDNSVTGTHATVTASIAPAPPHLAAPNPRHGRVGRCGVGAPASTPRLAHQVVSSKLAHADMAAMCSVMAPEAVSMI
jgi:hypothetical protein